MKVQQPKLYEIIIVFIIFLVMMSMSVAVFDISFQIPLFASWFLLIGFGLKLNYTYKELEDSIYKGIAKGFAGVLILLSVGALIGTWIAGGIVPSLVYYGLEIINPSIFLVVAMIVCAITSLSTGTSFGTIGTTGIAMMGVGASFGIPLPLVAGAIISGAYVGDKLSPLSDTTVMTASMTHVDVIEHVKGMLPVGLPSFIITALIFTIVGFFYVDQSADLTLAESAAADLQEAFNIHWYNLVPLVVTLLLLALRYSPIPVIMFGAFLGVLWGIFFQGLNAVTAIESVYSGNAMESNSEFLNELLDTGGIESMLGVIALVILSLGLGGLLDKLGILRYIANAFDTWVQNSNGKLTFATMFTAFLGNMFGSSAYVGVIAGSTTTAKLYDDRGIDRRVLSRNSEGGGTISNPMIPWTDAGVFIATTLGIPTLSYLPFMFYNFVGIIVTFVFGYMSWFFWQTKKSEVSDYEELEKTDEVQN